MQRQPSSVASFSPTQLFAQTAAGEAPPMQRKPSSIAAFSPRQEPPPVLPRNAVSGVVAASPSRKQEAPPLPMKSLSAAAVSSSPKLREQPPRKEGGATVTALRAELRRQEATNSEIPAVLPEYSMGLEEGIPQAPPPSLLLGNSGIATPRPLKLPERTAAQPPPTPSPELQAIVGEGDEGNALDALEDSSAAGEWSESTPRMRIAVGAGKLPAPFTLECVAVRGLAHERLREIPLPQLTLEASCMQAELLVGTAHQPAEFWGRILPPGSTGPAMVEEHFQVSLEEGGLMLEHLASGSSARTFVNGERVEGQRVVQPGDVISTALGPSCEAAISFLLATFDCDPVVLDVARGIVDRLSQSMAGESTLRPCEAASKMAQDPMLRDLLATRSAPADFTLIESKVAPIMAQQCVTLLCVIS